MAKSKEPKMTTYQMLKALVKASVKAEAKSILKEILEDTVKKAVEKNKFDVLSIIEDKFTAINAKMGNNSIDESAIEDIVQNCLDNSDFVTSDDVDDKVNDAVQNLDFDADVSISVR